MNENLALEPPALSSLYSNHPFYILEKNSAASFFEPVVSVHRRGILGLEALGRGIDPNDLSLIGPQDLFRQMGEEDFYLKLGLDRLFRQKGLESFSSFQQQKPRLLLFLDIEPSVLEENIVGSGHLIHQVEESGLDPRRVVVQIPLAGKWDPRLVDKFIQIQRQNRMLVCLKDINAGPERMRSILEFNPDLVKLEDGLVRGLAHSPEKQASVRKVVKLAHTLGIVVVAGSLDNEEDALAALEMGTDLLQGSYFTRDHAKNLVLTLGRKSRMMFLSARFQRRLNLTIHRDRDLKKRCERAGEFVLDFFEKQPLDQLEALAPSLFEQMPALECLYRLNPQGLQVGNVVLSGYPVPDRQLFLFEPSAPGSDHSFKEYFYFLERGEEKTMSEPYLSMNSGHLCVTAAKEFPNASGDGSQILCADFNLSKI